MTYPTHLQDCFIVTLKHVNFKPADNFSGTISDVITFKVWDGTMGHANSATGISTNLAVAGVYDMDTSSSIASRAIAISADGNTAVHHDKQQIRYC